jgi:hypothetical protein
MEFSCNSIESNEFNLNKSFRPNLNKTNKSIVNINKYINPHNNFNSVDVISCHSCNSTCNHHYKLEELNSNINECYNVFEKIITCIENESNSNCVKEICEDSNSIKKISNYLNSNLNKYEVIRHLINVKNEKEHYIKDYPNKNTEKYCHLKEILKITDDSYKYINFSNNNGITDEEDVNENNDFILDLSNSSNENTFNNTNNIMSYSLNKDTSNFRDQP